MNHDNMQILEVAKMYYLNHMTQEDIAQKLYLSRSKVSRLLKQAKAENYISFVITGETYRNHFLETELMESFSLKDVHVTKTGDSLQATLAQMAPALSDYLVSILQESDTIAVARGKTLQTLSRDMPKKVIPSLKIVQVIGSLGDSPEIMENELGFIKKFAAVFHATPYNLYSPFAMTNSDEKQMFLQLPYIRQTLQLARKAGILLLSLGDPYAGDALWRSFLSREELAQTAHVYPAGTFCGYFYDINGKPIHQPWNDRMIGLSLSQLTSKEYIIGAVSGTNKVLPTLGALRGKMINILFIDEKTALELLIQNQLHAIEPD